MTNRSLTTYLNDHLAGSVVALELLEHLIAHSQGLNQEPLIHLRSEIEQDQKVLQTLLHDLGGKESPLRKAAGWVTEKLGRAKLKLDDSGEGDFRDFEAFEAVALGIQGKLSLWRALAAVGIPASTSIDLEKLQARATDQFNEVERLRLLAAARALGPHSDRKS
jgi:hypothetical protein